MEKSVLVAGAGISGIGAARLLLEKKEAVILYDGNEQLDENTIKGHFDINSNITVVLGQLTKEVVDTVKYCVISPGIPLDTPFVQLLEENHIPIWSEVELAYQMGNGTVVAITGTNGKTTTTALVGEIVTGFVGENNTFVIGNIGTPYTEKALEMKKDSIVVAEISSFQLETIIDFHPKVSAILNITPDHLNRHKTMEIYAQTKEKITKNQTGDDVCVLNYDDKVLREFGKTLSCNVIYFSSTHKLEEGFYLDGDKIVWSHNKQIIEIINVNELNIVGQCNYENAMAAVAMTLSLNIPLEIVQKAMKNFKAVEHRIEYVATIDGVTYYNDSKGTNPDAAIQAVKAMKGKTVLIAGGYDKESEYDLWIQAFDNKIKKLLLMGQTKEKIKACAEKYGFTETIFVNDMEEAVTVASKLAESGESVLLSPACASWGMFKNYEERGRMFKELVHKLEIKEK